MTFAPAGGFRHRFEQTGSFDYLCRLHPDMTAKVTVVESGADGAQAGLVKAVAAGPRRAPRPRRNAGGREAHASRSPTTSTRRAT